VDDDRRPFLQHQVRVKIILLGVGDVAECSGMHGISPDMNESRNWFAIIIAGWPNADDWLSLKRARRPLRPQRAT